jgi:hypothetical protein
MEAIQNIRDIVLIIVGIVWSLITLTVLAVTAVAGVLLVRYLGKAQALIEGQGGALVGSLQTAVEGVRERTASLPHYDTGSREAGRRRIVTPREPRQREVKLTIDLPLPFLRRKKPWYQRLIGR